MSKIKSILKGWLKLPIVFLLGAFVQTQFPVWKTFLGFGEDLINTALAAF